MMIMMLWEMLIWTFANKCRFMMKINITFQLLLLFLFLQGFHMCVLTGNACMYAVCFHGVNVLVIIIIIKNRHLGTSGKPKDDPFFQAYITKVSCMFFNQPKLLVTACQFLSNYTLSNLPLLSETLLPL